MKYRNFLLSVIYKKEDEYGEYYDESKYWFYSAKEAREHFKCIKKDKTIVFASLCRFRNDCAFLSEKVLLDKRAFKPFINYYIENMR